MKSRPDLSTQVLVVGAGPVGLLAALSAARAGLDVTLLDQVERGFGHGHATVLHPSTLRLLARLGLASQLTAQGTTISSLGLHCGGAPLVELELPSPALALPQGLLEDALHQAVRGAGVSLLTPVEASVIQQEDNEVRVRAVRRELVTLGSPAEYSEWQPIESFVIKARYVIGADGYESRVRAALGIDVAAIGPTESFAMFEGPTSTTLEPRLDLGYAGQLFSNTLTVAPNRARLGFQIATGLDATADMARLRELSPERAPWFHYAACTGVDWGAVTHFERRLVRRFGHGRVWLAGDAAHVTNPFGAQSMNIGLSEAAALVDRIHAGSRRGDATDSLRDYGLCCQREWYRLFGYHVKFELLPHAPEWLGSCARKLLPVLPVSGADLNAVLQELGLVLD